MDPSGRADPGGRHRIDTSVAHSARVHDYRLGGKDNFAADRAAGDAVMAAYPGIVASVRANRAFLARAVRFLAGEAGITQFLDGLDLVPPGVVPVPQWRPGSELEARVKSSMWGGVARR